MSLAIECHKNCCAFHLHVDTEKMRGRPIAQADVCRAEIVDIHTLGPTRYLARPYSPTCSAMQTRWCSARDTQR